MKERKGVNRYIKLLVLCMGASAIYLLPYLRWTYYDILLEAIGITNKQFGITMSVYGVASMIFYAPGGWMADRFSPRKLLTAAFIITGILGLYFATYPGYLMQIVIHFVWGCAATLIFWAAMLKATRQFGDSEEQGKLFGLLEGGRGLMSTIFSAASLFAFGKLGESIGGLTGIIVAIAIVNIIAGILVWFVFDDSNHNQDEASRINLKMVGKVLRMPAVWLLAFVIITCYSVYIGSTYMTPYFTQVLGATASISALIAIIRNYVLQLLGGPSGGFLATKMRSTTKVVTLCFIMIVITLGGIAFLPSKTSMLIFLVVLMILMCSAIFAMRGIYFAIVDEVNVPLNVTGTAVGIISVIGFLPDVYMNTIAGSLLDKYPGAAGYRYLFVIMLLFSVAGLIASCLLLSKIKKQKV